MTDFESCASCGGAVPAMAKFCPNCGVAFDSDSPGQLESAMPSEPAEPLASVGTYPEFVQPQAALLLEPTAASEGSHRRATWPRLVGVAAALVGVAALALFAVAWWVDKPNRDYISALRESGALSGFSSEAEAIAHAKAVCASLESGGKAQGSGADLAATSSYCPKFSSGFHVLETKVIEGSFELIDTSYSQYSRSIDTSGRGCTGANGYDDIHAGTSVVIKNGDGKFLATEQLSMGSGLATLCTFDFKVTLTEGEQDYVVTVSHRGDVHYTWDALKERGIHLSLGD